MSKVALNKLSEIDNPGMKYIINFDMLIMLIFIFICYLYANSYVQDIGRYTIGIYEYDILERK